MLSDMMYNTQGKIPSRRHTSCRWSPFETPKSPERRCLGHKMRISRPRSSDRRQGSGRVPRAVMRKHPNRLVVVRGGRGGFSAVIRRHFRAWQEQSSQRGQNNDPSSLMSLTANEISDLNDLLIKLSLSEPMSGLEYHSDMDEDLDIQTEPLHDDGKPREAITALTCPTPKIPGLTLSAPLINLPDLDLDGSFHSQPAVQNMLIQLIESTNVKDLPALPKAIPAVTDTDAENDQKKDGDKTEEPTKDAANDNEVATVPEKSLSVSSSDSSPSYRIILLILILMYYSREINKGFVVPDQALDIIQHLELCRSRPLPVITPEPIES